MTNVQEIWKDIPGWESIYSISNLGRVKSHSRYRSNQKNGNGYLAKEIILREQLNPQGYPYICLHYNKKKGKFCIHRLLAITFIPNIDNKPCINHIDGNKRNYSISNLEWCTYSENNKHAYDHNLKKPYVRYGERNPRCKYNTERIIEINELFNSGMSLSQVERVTGIPKSTLHNIQKGKTRSKG